MTSNLRQLEGYVTDLCKLMEFSNLRLNDFKGRPLKVKNYFPTAILVLSMERGKKLTNLEKSVEIHNEP